MAKMDRQRWQDRIVAEYYASLTKSNESEAE